MITCSCCLIIKSKREGGRKKKEGIRGLRPSMFDMNVNMLPIITPTRQPTFSDSSIWLDRSDQIITIISLIILVSLPTSTHWTLREHTRTSFFIHPWMDKVVRNMTQRLPNLSRPSHPTAFKYQQLLSGSSKIFVSKCDQNTNVPINYAAIHLAHWSSLDRTSHLWFMRE